MLTSLYISEPPLLMLFLKKRTLDCNLIWWGMQNLKKEEFQKLNQF